MPTVFSSPSAQKTQKSFMFKHFFNFKYQIGNFVAQFILRHSDILNALEMAV